MLKKSLKIIFGEDAENYPPQERVKIYALFSGFLTAGMGIFSMFLKYLFYTGLSVYTLVFTAILLSISASLIIYRKTSNMDLFIKWNIASCFISVVAHHIMMGGFVGTNGTYIWAIVAIVASVILYDSKTTRMFFIIYIVLFILLYVYQIIFPRPIPQMIGGSMNFMAINILGIGYLVYSTFSLLITDLYNQYDRSQELVIELENGHKQIVEAMETLKATQTKLIQSEKMASLGQLIAGIAHEINTPIGAIKASSEFIYTTYSEKLSEINNKINSYSKEEIVVFNEFIRCSFAEKEYKSALEKRKVKKIYSGLLEDTHVADINNMSGLLIEMDLFMPEDIEFVAKVKDMAFFESMVNDAYIMASLYKSAQNISIATEKISKIVFSLKSFSHIDSSGEISFSGVEEAIDIVLTLYHNQLKHGITVEKEYETDNYPIPCYPSELNQVWTNVIQNAIHAMEEHGVLTITVKKDDVNLYVIFKDTGCGISSEVLERMFEPFYTTKATGEGTGLGLDISKKIIDKHNGTIEVESEVGKGTTFKISLPLTI